ncbi:hypothetical protein LEM8419_02687 [Neolewinella maritima]|uniref:AB hydrolase-1 domain-containing protein n=1 Tax=Neolewinella maritima TaxID=1383882 RepID=A0ABM9B3R5_9BACT|nr:alpha/beta fold hydrolase [Neolewinella maritima]CAH1001781.1 hypothetical protein LEM8419_02687 [Neolewinella maritima]
MTLKRLTYRSIAAAINGLSYLHPRLAGRSAFHLFATPPPPHIRPKEQAFLDTARRNDQPSGDHLIPVYEWGPEDGPVVFCAYGWGYNVGRWRHFVPRLVAAGYRVVAFDLPGHGHCAGSRQLTYLRAAEVEMDLIRWLGGTDLILAHSFGGSCLVESLALLPPQLRPRRICLLAIVSEVRWLFAGFVRFMGLRDVVYRQMQARIEQLSGRSLDEFDVATVAAQLHAIPTLLVHDPEDAVTAYRNARRNHSHWRGSWLYSPVGAGHHLGTAEVTAAVLDWLIEGAVPAGAVQNTGELQPLPAVVDAAAMEVNGVTDFYA